MKVKDITAVKFDADYPKAVTASFENAWSMVETHCSEYLAIAKSCKKLLYRGFDRGKVKSSLKTHEGRLYRSNLDIIIGQPRENRNPVYGGDKTKARVCDTYLEVAGFDALRGNSLFCNSSQGVASRWGTSYMIFPANGFTFGYSRRFSNVPAADYKYPQPTTKLLCDLVDNGGSINLMPDNELKKAAEEFVIANQISKTNLNFAMMNEKDLWFKGRYIAFQNDFSYSAGPKAAKYYSLILKKMGFDHSSSCKYY